MNLMGVGVARDHSLDREYPIWTYLGSGGSSAISYSYLVAGQEYRGNTGTTTPFTWATSDFIIWNILYHAA